MYQQDKYSKDFFLGSLLRVNAFFSTLAVGFILLFLFKESFSFLETSGVNLFIDQSWFPTEGQFNLVPIIIGTLATSLGAIVLALPLGLFSAIFTSFYAPKKMRWILIRVIELYSGLPSVIFGFWGLMEIVPLLNKISPPGQSLLAGILILSLMIFPIITLNLLASFDQSSKKHLNVSESLGLKKSTYIWDILIPETKKSLMNASLLSLGRALGETMAVLMVCGNIVQTPSSLMEPIRTLTANIALEMAYAVDSHRSALFATGLILFLLITLLTLLNDRLGKRS